MTLEVDLIKSGLNEKEARIYLAALELGATSVLEISRKTGLKRTTIYEILPSLIQSGLISQTSEGKRRRLIAESPEKLFNAKKQELDSLRGLLPSLEAFRNVAIEKPSVKWFEGKDAIQQVFAVMIRDTSVKEPILGIEGKFNAMHQKIGQDFFKKILKEKKKRGLESRTLLTMSNDEFEQSTRKTPWSFDHPIAIRLIKDPDNRFRFNFYMYQNRLAIIDAAQLLALIVENQPLKQSFELLFETLWRDAEETSFKI